MLDDVLAVWAARIEEFRRLHVLVDGARLCEQMRDELLEARRSESVETLSLTEAAERSGYSREHLGRLVRAGTIPNAGRPNAPRIRTSDLPHKATSLLPGNTGAQIGQTSKRQIVRSLVASDGSA